VTAALADIGHSCGSFITPFAGQNRENEQKGKMKEKETWK
jgi:hypothetical protein